MRSEDQATIASAARAHLESGTDHGLWDMIVREASDEALANIAIGLAVDPSLIVRLTDLVRRKATALIAKDADELHSILAEEREELTATK